MITATKVGPWTFPVCEKPIHMNVEETSELLRLLNVWKEVFPRTGSLCERQFGVPSVITRFDYVVTHGRVRVYEIEERPAGLGVACAISPHFRTELGVLLGRIQEELGRPLAIYVSPVRDGSSDDDILAQLTGLKIYRGEVSSDILSGHAWYVRANRDEESASRIFTPHAVSSIAEEGNKSYGLSLGLWSEIESLDFSTAFVLKPARGSRFEKILIWTPEKVRGSVTRSKIETAVREKHVAYVQPYFPPEQYEFLGDGYHAIRRAYFVFDPTTRQYESIGGLWLASPTVRVHGTPESVTGVLQKE